MKNWLSAKIGLKSSNDSTPNQIIKKHIKFNSSNSANVCIYRYCNAQVLIKRHLIHFCHRMNPDHSVNWILIETSELLTERESFVIQSHYSEYSVILYWKIQSSFTKKKNKPYCTEPSVMQTPFSLTEIKSFVLHRRFPSHSRLPSLGPRWCPRGVQGSLLHRDVGRAPADVRDSN